MESTFGCCYQQNMISFYRVIGSFTRLHSNIPGGQSTWHSPQKVRIGAYIDPQYMGTVPSTILPLCT